MDSEKWKDNDKKVRRAQTLLPQWVDPAILGNLEEYKNPMDAWEYLKGQDKMTNARALDIALTKMGRLKLAEPSTLNPSWTMILSLWSTLQPVVHFLTEQCGELIAERTLYLLPWFTSEITSTKR